MCNPGLGPSLEKGSWWENQSKIYRSVNSWF